MDKKPDKASVGDKLKTTGLLVILGLGLLLTAAWVIALASLAVHALLLLV